MDTTFAIAVLKWSLLCSTVAAVGVVALYAIGGRVGTALYHICGTLALIGMLAIWAAVLAALFNDAASQMLKR